MAASVFAVAARARAQEQAVTVVQSYPHDADAFTQGLLFHDGKLYESTGKYGGSSLRRVDPATGVVEHSVSLDAMEFGEGLARVDDKLIQLTWKVGKAYVYAIDDFRLLETHRFSGEGWGLCYDGTRLVMSDGSSTLTFRDPTTFAAQGELEVRRDGRAVEQLNELECVADRIYANVWMQEYLLEIDPSSGEVLREIGAGGLLSAAEAAPPTNVLNGIAHNPQNGRFFLTGKFWPKLFEVELPTVPDSDESGSDPGSETTGATGSTSADEGEEPSLSGGSDPSQEPKAQSGCRCRGGGTRSPASFGWVLLLGWVRARRGEIG